MTPPPGRPKKPLPLPDEEEGFHPIPRRGKKAKPVSDGAGGARALSEPAKKRGKKHLLCAKKKDNQSRSTIQARSFGKRKGFAVVREKEGGRGDPGDHQNGRDPQQEGKEGLWRERKKALTTTSTRGKGLASKGKEARTRPRWFRGKKSSCGEENRFAKKKKENWVSRSRRPAAHILKKEEALSNQTQKIPPGEAKKGRLLSRFGKKDLPYPLGEAGEKKAFSFVGKSPITISEKRKKAGNTRTYGPGRERGNH